MSLRILITLLLVPALAFANGSQNSGDGSQNSGNSSQNSGGSSDGSGQSSQDSGEGSRGTGQSSETSAGTSENSGQSSDSKSSENSSNQASSQLAAVGSVLVVAGASVYLGYVAARMLSEGQFQVHSGHLAAYLRENHALIARDVVEGDGVVLAGWYTALGLSDEEQALLRQSLDGSHEQTAMLAALDGVEGVEDARAFAGQFVRLLHRALGEARLEALVAVAARRLS